MDSLDGDTDIEQIRFIGVADLRGVPNFLKGFAKGKFPRDEDKSVLMDWKGIFAEAYQFKPKMSNILVFDHSGDLVHKTSVQAVDQQKLAVIAEKINLF